MTIPKRALRGVSIVLAALGFAWIVLGCSMEPRVYVGTKPQAPSAGNPATGGTGAGGEGDEHEGSAGDDHEDTADEHQDDDDSSGNP